MLQLWVGVRMESRSEYLDGPETLGMSPQTFDPKASSHGKVLVPPVMSAQLEMIATSTILEPKRKEVLNGLRLLIEERNLESQFAVYLCLFILLHSCALLTDFEKKQAEKYGLSVSKQISSTNDTTEVTKLLFPDPIRGEGLCGRASQRVHYPLESFSWMDQGWLFFAQAFSVSI